jgi:hypothetical protein
MEYEKKYRGSQLLVKKNASIAEKCVKYCSLGTYFEEKDGKKRPVVKNPNNFVILCSGATQSAPWSNIASIQKTNQRANQDPKK